MEENKINITDIKISKGDWGNTKAFVTITIDKVFTVTGIKVIQGSDGFFIGMPSRKQVNKETQKEEYKDICYASKEYKQELQDIILKEFNGNANFITVTDTEPLPF